MLDVLRALTTAIEERGLVALATVIETQGAALAQLALGSRR